jgi:putative OPT family oligopeptide transporter
LPEKPAYRELTVASVVWGAAFGAVLNVGIVFAGLQIGFTIVGSTVAAVVGFGILRGILRRGSILEVNIFQTVASAVNTANAGIIFTVPVLFLLGREGEIDFPALLLATTAGSVLGVVLIIPLRKQIIEYERLRFPEGVAVAAILKSPGAGVQKAKLLLGAILVSAVVTALTRVGLVPEEIDLGKTLEVPASLRLVFAVSLLSLGAGYLAGRPGLVVLYGTILNFWVLIPLSLALGWLPEALAQQFAEYKPFSAGGLRDHTQANEFANAFRSAVSNKVGIGMILGGALAGIAVALPALKAALASLRASEVERGAAGPREEVSLRLLNRLFVAGLAVLLVATKLAGGEHVDWARALLATLAGGAWLWLAGLVVAQTTGRTDWSPLSGLALIAIAILMGILGVREETIVPAVTFGAAICVATSMCADMIADLKTGYLVGARPRRQQVAQLSVCALGPPIALATVILLWNVYGFGPKQTEVLHGRAKAAGPEALSAFEDAGGSATKLPEGVPQLGAPQAGALESAITIVQKGDIPLAKYLAGAVLGFLISLLVSPGLGVMVGLSLYLPFEYMAVFGVGGILNILVSRWKGPRFAEDKGVPVAAGLIVGDALVEVAHALYRVLEGTLGGGS